jgi:hypothetical protein
MHVVRWFTLALGAALSLVSSFAETAPDRRAIETAATSRASPVLPPRRAAVEGLNEPVANLRITNLNGQDISEAVAPRSEGGRLTLNIPRSSAIVLRPKTIPTIRATPATRMVLPGGAVVAPEPSPTSPQDPATLDNAKWFRVTLATSPMPAPWDAQADGYVTQLTFGLKRPDGAPPDLKLEQPVIVKLAYRDLIAPEVAMISLDAPGLENEKTVALHFVPQSPTPTLLVRSSISEVDVQLTALPRLAVLPDRNSAIGLGLDLVKVVVSNLFPDGRLAPVETDTPVLLTVEGGPRLVSTNVVLKAGTSAADFSLRTSGLQKVVVRASANGVVGLGTFDQRFPFAPLSLALLGGALGGYARRFLKGARRASSRRRVIEGLLVSTVAFVAGILGVGYFDLPSAIVATEAGAFLTGALSGFVGVSVLDVLAKKRSSS